MVHVRRKSSAAVPPARTGEDSIPSCRLSALLGRSLLPVLRDSHSRFGLQALEELRAISEVEQDFEPDEKDGEDERLQERIEQGRRAAFELFAGSRRGVRRTVTVVGEEGASAFRVRSKGPGDWPIAPAASCSASPGAHLAVPDKLRDPARGKSPAGDFHGRVVLGRVEYVREVAEPEQDRRIQSLRKTG